MPQALHCISEFHKTLRRTKWFGYVRRRFDLISFDELASWCSRNDQKPKLEIIRDLEDGVIHDEFGPPNKPHLAYLNPEWEPPEGKPDRGYPLRLTVGQIGFFCRGYQSTTFSAHLWAPRTLCVAWFARRPYLTPPPWLNLTPPPWTHAAVIEGEWIPPTAQTTGTGEVTADAQPVPADPDFIDLTSEPPTVPRYRDVARGGPFPEATQHIDACIRKIAALHGGQTNRDTLRKWGRYWLRTKRNADTTKDVLEAHFRDPQYKTLQRPDGGARSHPRTARGSREPRA